MGDIIKRHYEKYFSVLIFHHYFLDEGFKVFELKKNQKQSQLTTYDSQKIFQILPTPATQQLLRNEQAIFRTTTLGFVVFVPAGAKLSETMIFTLVAVDPLFNNYTALTLKKPTIKTYQQLENEQIKAFRVKHRVFELTNVGKPTVFLSRTVPDIGSGPFAREELFADSGKLYQAIDDGAGNALRVEITAPVGGTLPPFLNQTDIPTTQVDFVEAQQAPDGNTVWTSKSEAIRGILLPDVFPEQVFAIIKIDPSVNAHFDSPESPPDFEVHLKSRGTFWRYFNKNDGQYKPESPDFWSPLTIRGKGATKRKAIPDAIKIELEVSSNITKLISEINP